MKIRLFCEDNIDFLQTLYDDDLENYAKDTKIIHFLLHEALLLANLHCCIYVSLVKSHLLVEEM